MIGYIVWHCVPFYEVNSNMCSVKTLLNGDSVLYHWKFNEKYENVCILLYFHGCQRCREVHWLCWNRWNEAFSELHRFFVDARAAPAIWISGLAVDDEIPATPALPGDFRLPVSEAMKETAWNDRFNDLGIPGLCVFWGSTETLSQAWLLGLARCLGLPYGMLGRHSQSQLDNLTQCRIIGSTWIHLAPVYTKVLLRECAWRFDPRLVSKARCDQLTVLTMTTVLCFPNLQSSFHLFSEQVWEVSISHTSTWARRLSAVRCCQMLSDVLRCHQVATQILRSTPRCSRAKRSGSLIHVGRTTTVALGQPQRFMKDH